MKEFEIGRVAADPSLVPKAAAPGAAPGTAYFRYHGSPRMYYSAYEERAIAEIAGKLLATAQRSQDAWCIFDNTAAGAALANALALREMLAGPPAAEVQ